MPKDEQGRKPSIATITYWRDSFGWIERADALDAEVSRQLDTEAIEKRKEKLRELAENGRVLKEAGLNQLKSGVFDSSAAAVRAVIAGADMEFKYSGMADLVAQVGKMSDRQLTKKALQLLGKNEDEEETVEGEIEEDSDFLEEDDNT